MEIRNPKLARRSFSEGGAESRKLRAKSYAGFTLIELLVVISIISLLVGILLPSFNAAKKLAYAARTRSIINELSNGTLQYKLENKYYPGQQYNGLGSYTTGSELLAHAMFTDKSTPTPQFPASSYASYDSSKLDENTPYKTGIQYSILDRFPEPMAILYYPARLGQSGLAQYQYSDNSAYTTSTTSDYTNQSDFQDFIVDERFGTPSTTPYKPGEFLLIGAGIDRLYGTADDVKNW